MRSRRDSALPDEASSSMLPSHTIPLKWLIGERRIEYGIDQHRRQSNTAARVGQSSARSQRLRPNTIIVPRAQESNSDRALAIGHRMRKILNLLLSRRKRDRAVENVTTDVVDTAIRSVAILIDDRVAFGLQAASVAARLGPRAIDMLVSRLHSPSHPTPEAFEPSVRGLEGWLAAWQFAIFEILFHFHDSALDNIREIAWGEYDWTQGNALEILVRLAAKGIERERTISDFRRNFEHVCEEAKRYAVAPLLHRAKFEPEVAAIVSKLQSVPDWREVVYQLERTQR